MRLEKLEKVFEEAKNNGDNFIGVFISTPKSPKEELIINPKENFDFKLEYYKNAYNENCELKNYPPIKIVNIASGNSLNTLLAKSMKELTKEERLI